MRHPSLKTALPSGLGTWARRKKQIKTDLTGSAEADFRVVVHPLAEVVAVEEAGASGEAAEEAATEAVEVDSVTEVEEAEVVAVATAAKWMFRPPLRIPLIP
jgi:hypothetical protein